MNKNVLKTPPRNKHNYTLHIIVTLIHKVNVTLVVRIAIVLPYFICL